jgi:N-carbamoylputrescine amidase
MSRIVKAGIIQMANKLDTSASPREHREAMLEAHRPYIEDAGRQGVQMLCFQEIFTGPYFCPLGTRCTPPPRPFPTARPPN